MSTIGPCLWFADDLEAAMTFYTSIFPRSAVHSVLRHPAAGPGPTGELMAADFDLDGVRFHGINAGPAPGFTEAVSLQVDCADQSEVDYYWDSLVDGGEESRCGWLTDRFGVSWQIVPTRLLELYADPDPDRVDAVTRAMLSMRRLVIADLEAAAEAGSAAGR